MLVVSMMVETGIIKGPYIGLLMVLHPVISGWNEGPAVTLHKWKETHFMYLGEEKQQQSVGIIA